MQLNFSLTLWLGVVCAVFACSADDRSPNDSTAGAGNSGGTASAGSGNSGNQAGTSNTTGGTDASGGSLGSGGTRSGTGGRANTGGSGTRGPNGWDDWVWGLVSSGDAVHNTRLKQANVEGAGIGYRYVYLNAGPSKDDNQFSRLLFRPAEKVDYAVDSQVKAGVNPAFVLYMLQEDAGGDHYETLKQHAADTTFMQQYFDTVRAVAEKANGHKAIFVVEPDTWGYALQLGGESAASSPAKVTSLGYDWLSGYPDTIAGVAQGIIGTIRTFAPDARVGHMISLWSTNASVVWTEEQLAGAAQKTANFMLSLYGDEDRGDFIAFEKNGASAGFWKTLNNDYYYWTDVQMKNWLKWTKTVSSTVQLPSLGWQISIGHMGLPNTVDRYEDNFMEYFFGHVQEFLDAGFVGILAGAGASGGTDYSLKTEGDVADNGWFIEKLKEFEKGRPYL